MTAGVYLLPFLRGLGLGASLIIAIGAQNAFVLRQSLRWERAVLVAAICAACDAALITLGAGGVGGLIAHLPWLASLGGTAFLLFYGFGAFRRARRPAVLDIAAAPPLRAGLVVATLLVSLLNPHVYLDTVVLVGHLVLRPRARRGQSRAAVPAARAWQVLDCLVGAVMWVIAVGLLQSGLIWVQWQ